MAQPSSIVAALAILNESFQSDGGIVREYNAIVIPTCQSFDTSRQVHIVANHGVIHFFTLRADVADYGGAGVDTDTGVKRHPAFQAPLRLQFPEPPTHMQ